MTRTVFKFGTAVVRKDCNTPCD